MERLQRQNPAAAKIWSIESQLRRSKKERTAKEKEKKRKWRQAQTDAWM